MAIADMIGLSLRPKYYIGVETRTYLDDANDELLVGIPDAAVISSTTSTNPNLGNTVLNSPSIAVQDRPLRVMLPMPIEVKERYLEVRELRTDAVITVIEVLSPKNKRNGKGRDRYQKKRQTILGSSHLIEIDLLRRYEPMEMMGEVTKSDYRILISRSHQRPFADLYGFTLLSAIPWFPLPLKPGDKELTVDLQAIITGVYDRAGYDLRVDYRQPPPSPPLSLSDSLWLEKLLTPLRGE